jgi:hypothetical protein
VWMAAVQWDTMRLGALVTGVLSVGLFVMGAATLRAIRLGASDGLPAAAPGASSARLPTPAPVRFPATSTQPAAPESAAL